MHDVWGEVAKSLMDSAEITLEAVPSVGDVPAEEWNACANPVPDPDSLNGLDTLAGSCPGRIRAAPSDTAPTPPSLTKSRRFTAERVTVLITFR